MAIYHFSASIVTGGKSPVAAAAYRHRATMVDTVHGQTWSYTRSKDLVHAEICAPANPPPWLAEVLAQPTINKQSAELWNEVLAQERRADAQTARDIIIALPVELTREQSIAAMREFARTQLVSKGIVVDWVMHDKGDGNPHVHLMHTMRPVEADGFGRKRNPIIGDDGKPVLRPNGQPAYSHFIAGNRQELIEIRHAWANTLNKHLALAGHDVRVDASSYVDLGIAIPPTSHLSPVAAAIARDKRNSEVLARLGIELKDAAAAVIANPNHLLKIITIERSTFTKQDIARTLHRFIDTPADFSNAFAKVMASPELHLLKPATPEDGQEVYSTRSMIELEQGMAYTADLLASTMLRPIARDAIARAIAAAENKNPAKRFTFSNEQVAAVRHVTAPKAIASVIGMAGAGKSTLLEAANRAWTQNGQRVLGAALSGIAAEGLEKSAGIPARTNTAWLNAWAKGYDTLKPGDVFVLDEAGMVPSNQMAGILAHVQSAGAKIVLVGDPMQLQPIEAGAAFRAVAARTGSVTLSEIFRQHDDWGKTATQHFSTGKIVEALDAYTERGHIKSPNTTADAIRMIVSDWADARASGAMKAADMLVMTQTNADVFTLNQALRSIVAAEAGLSDAIDVMTARGPRTFAAGDRIICLKNANFKDSSNPKAPEQSVKNGMLGTVTSTARGNLAVRLDAGRSITISPATYTSFDHGYAATVHKSQGATVQRTFVLATPMMDRHLGLVAMSRHRFMSTLYAPRDCFTDRAALNRTLSRDRQKSTTLDYASEFAHRRGIDTITTLAPAVASNLAAARHALSTTWDRLATAYERTLSAHRIQLVSVWAAFTNARTQPGSEAPRPASVSAAGSPAGDTRQRLADRPEPLRSQSQTNLGDTHMASPTPPKPVYGPAVVTQITEGDHAGKWQTMLASFQKYHEAVHAVMRSAGAVWYKGESPKDPLARSYLSEKQPSADLLKAVDSKLEFANAEAALADRVLANRAAFGPLATAIPFKDAESVTTGTRREGNAIVVKFPQYHVANKAITDLKEAGVAVTFNSHDKTYRIVVSDPAKVEAVTAGLQKAGDKIATRTFATYESRDFQNPARYVCATRSEHGIITVAYQKDPDANAKLKEALGDMKPTYNAKTHSYSLPPATTPEAYQKQLAAITAVDNHIASTYLIPPGAASASERGHDGIPQPPKAVAAALAITDEGEKLKAFAADPKLAVALNAYVHDTQAVLNADPKLAQAVDIGDHSDIIARTGLSPDAAHNLIDVLTEARTTAAYVEAGMEQAAGIDQAQAQQQAPAHVM